MGLPIPIDAFIHFVSQAMQYFLIVVVVYMLLGIFGWIEVDGLSSFIHNLITLFKGYAYAFFVLGILFFRYDPNKGIVDFSGLPKEITLEQSFVVVLSFFESISNFLSFIRTAKNRKRL